MSEHDDTVICPRCGEKCEPVAAAPGVIIYRCPSCQYDIPVPTEAEGI